MNKKIQLFSLVFGVWLSTSAWAQDPTSGGDLDLSAKSSTRDMENFVRGALEEMVNGVKSIGKMVEQARREQDEDKLTCLQSRLSYVRALLMVSERANGAMREARAEGLTTRSEHEFRKIAVAISKARQFLAEAEACLGEGGATPGTTELDVDDPSGLAEDDDTTPMDDYFTVVGTDPPNTSPFE